MTSAAKSLVLNPIAVADDGKPVDWNGLIIDTSVAVISTVAIAKLQPKQLPFAVASDVFVLVKHSGDLIKITRMVYRGVRGGGPASVYEWQTIADKNSPNWTAIKANWEISKSTIPGFMTLLHDGYHRAVIRLHKYGELAQQKTIELYDKLDNFDDQVDRWDAQIEQNIDNADNKFTRWVDKITGYGDSPEVFISTGLWIAYLIVTIILICIFANTVMLAIDWWSNDDEQLPLLVANAGALLLVGGINYNIWARQCALTSKNN